MAKQPAPSSPEGDYNVRQDPLNTTIRQRRRNIIRTTNQESSKQKYRGGVKSIILERNRHAKFKYKKNTGSSANKHRVCKVQS